MEFLSSLLIPLIFIFLFMILPNRRRVKAHEALLRAFTQVQRKRKSRVIAMVHRQDSMGLLGVPVLKYIDLNDAEDILEAIRRTPDNMPLEIILHTPGGLVLPALQIARAIKAHPGRTTVFVPHYAMSGGTLIALAADEIVLSQHAVLGPIDPQIGGLPAASVMRVKQEKNLDATDDYTLILADVGEMAIRQLQSAAYELLQGTVSDNAARAVAEQLSSGRWTHDYPIIASHASELGLNVSVQMPNDIMNLMALFPSSLAGSSVKTADIEANSKNPPSTIRSAPMAPTMTGRGSLTGYQPGAGAQSFSYGPWNPNDIKTPAGVAAKPGPEQSDLRGQEHILARKKNWFSK